MTLPTASNHQERNSPIDNRLHGRALVVARGMWVSLVLGDFGVLVFNIPRYPHLLRQYQAPCSNAQCTTGGSLSPAALHTLHSLGVSPLAFAIVYTTLYSLVPVVVWVAAGMILAARKSDDWMALFVALFLVLFQTSVAAQGLISTTITDTIPLAERAPLWFVCFYAFCQGLAFPVLALFPNGRFVPGWMVWPTAGLVLLNALSEVSPPSANISTLGFSLELALFACLAGSMIYRYLHGTTLLERQQIKWLAFFIVVDLVLNWIGPVLLAQLFPQAFRPGSLPSALYQLVWPLTTLSIPISIGIAIARYRLWDIDRIINKTLVYGTLTALLAAVYSGAVIGAQELTQAVTGQRSLPPVVVVASTLLIAVLVNPLRRRIQATIDRRFYRSKYDAARTLQAFAATLRTETDLGELSEHLVSVVDETMQPAHVSLWLRQPDGAQATAPRDGRAQVGPMEGGRM